MVIKIKIGDVVKCINNSSRFGVLPDLTLNKCYKVKDVELLDIIITDDINHDKYYMTSRFKKITRELKLNRILK